MTFFTPVPVNVSSVNNGQIDFSQLDTIAGAIGGAFAVMIVFLVIGFLLMKFKVIRFGSVTATTEDSMPPVLMVATLDNLKESLDEVKRNIHVYTEEQQRCQRSLSESFIPRHEYERDIDELKGRQIKLREEVLPRDYVRREEMRELAKRMDSMDKKLDLLLEKG